MGSVAAQTTVVYANQTPIPEIVVTAPRIYPGQTLFTYFPNGAAGTPVIFNEGAFASITFNITSPFLGILHGDRDQDGKVDCVEAMVAGDTKVTSHFGWRTLKGSPDWHNGIDLRARTGRYVLAAKPGVVVGMEDRYLQGRGSGNGNYVRVNHDDGTQGVYLHLLKPSTRIKFGSRVLAGQVIGNANDTGTSEAPHLHYSEWKQHDHNSNPNDPNNFNDPASEYGTGSC